MYDLASVTSYNLTPRKEYMQRKFGRPPSPQAGAGTRVKDAPTKRGALFWRLLFFSAGLMVVYPFAVQFGYTWRSGLSGTHNSATAATSNTSTTRPNPNSNSNYKIDNTGAKKIPVFMSEPHGAVWEVWVEGLKRNDGTVTHVNLLHIDSHNDRMEVGLADSPFQPKPTDSSDSSGSSDRKQQLVEYLLKSPANIGDFITRGVFAGFVRHVAWMRSDFNVGYYNMPGVGSWKDKAVYSPKNGGTIGFVENFFVSSSSLTTLPPEVKTAGQLEGFSEMEYQTAPFFLEVPTTISVATIDTYQHVAGFMDPDKRPWILDIDLDYFASNDPSVVMFDRHGFGLDWLLSYFAQAFSCDDTDDSSADMAPFATAMENLSQLNANGKKPVRTNQVNKMLDGVSSLVCEVANITKINSLLGVLHSSPQQLLQWKAMWNAAKRDDFYVDAHDFFITLCDLEKIGMAPFGHPSRAEIKANARKLEAYLDRFVGGNGRPVMITVARSEIEDFYLPPHLGGLIQNTTVELLMRLFPGGLAQIDYHKSTRITDRIVYF